MTVKRIIALSYAKNALIKNSREYKRMKLYSEELDMYHVVVFTRSSEGYPNLIEDGKLFVHATNASTKLGMLVSSFFICRDILRSEKDNNMIVSCQDPFETSIVGVILSFYKKVYFHVQIHGDNFGNLHWVQENFFNRFRLYFGKKILERACKIRVVSKRIKRSLLEMGIPEKKIAVLPIQFDLRPFLEVGKDRKNIIKKDICTFLYVGRFSKEKNIELLLRAFENVYTENPNTSLRIVGSGSEKKYLLKLSQMLQIDKNVTFVDWTEDVVEEFNSADVFTLASNHEGYALVLLEAMASGLPIVTTNVGCVGDLVHDGSEGFVVGPKDVDCFTKVMKELADDASLRREVGERGYKKAVLLQASSENYLKRWAASYKSNVSL